MCSGSTPARPGGSRTPQVAVYLTYAAPAGYAMVGRALSLPRTWTDDPDRCAAAAVPEDVAFATKPALARAMIERAVDAGSPCAWVTGDEVDGADPTLRKTIATPGWGFVLAVAKSPRFTTGIGERRAIDLAVRLPAGAGAKGPRTYDWALVEAADPALGALADLVGAGSRGTTRLLIRRSLTDGEYAFYRVFSPRPVPLTELVRVAGVRRKIEESFAGSKELAALDEHQVRGWTSWHHWTVLAMLAHAFLSVETAEQTAEEPAAPEKPTSKTNR